MQEKRKTALRRLGGFVLFGLLALGLLAYTDQVLWDKSGTILGFYEEPEDSIDVIYIGGSHTNAAISPTQLYQEYGVTGYVLYSWSQPIWTGYHYLLEALKTQSPQVVVVDAFGLVYGNTYMTDVDMNSVSDQYSLLIPPSLNRLQLAIAMSRCQTEHKPFYSYFSLFQYHNRWKALTAEDLLWPLQSYRTTGKGFGPLYTTEVYEQQRQPDPLQANDLMYTWSRVYLQKLIDLSRERGFSLVMANYPYLATETEYGIYAQARELCEEAGVPFVDYLLDDWADAAGFDYGADMAEHAHVNYKGAQKLTAHLGSWLAQNYDLPDHRGDPAYAQWEQDAAFEARNLQDMDLRMTADLAGLLQKAATGDYLVAVASCGELTEADGSAVAGALAGQGLTRAAAALTQPGANLLALWDGTAWTETTGSGERLEGSLTAADGTVLTACSQAQSASILAPEAAGEEPGEVSRDRPGLNLVVADRATGALVYSVSFSTIHGYTAYTA